MRHGLATWVDDRCGNIFAPELFVLSQAYFFGAARDNPDRTTSLRRWMAGLLISVLVSCGRHPMTGFLKSPVDTTVVSHHDPAIEAMMEKYAGAGVSTNPEDYWADDPNIEKKIIAALLVIPADINYHFWKRVGAAIYNALGDDGYPLFVEWSQGSSRHNKDEASNACEWIWPACRKMSRKVTVATIFYYANKKNPRWRSEVAA